MVLKGLAPGGERSVGENTCSPILRSEPIMLGGGGGSVRMRCSSSGSTSFSDWPSVEAPAFGDVAPRDDGAEGLGAGRRAERRREHMFADLEVRADHARRRWWLGPHALLELRQHVVQ